MKVSIIIPAYNSATTIRDTISSCINQTHNDLEIIIVNDCSTDNTNEVINEFNDDRIRVINNSINVGAGGSKYIGSTQARGDYTMFLDSDDWLDLNCVEMMLNEAITYNADIVDCGINFILHDQINIYRYTQHEVLSAEDALLNSNRFMRYLNTKLIRRTLWDSVSCNKRRVVEDSTTSFYLYNFANVVVRMTETFYNYRQLDNSLSHSISHNALLIYQALAAVDIITFCEQYRPQHIDGCLKAFQIRVDELLAEYDINGECFDDELREIVNKYSLYADSSDIEKLISR